MASKRGSQSSRANGQATAQTWFSHLTHCRHLLAQEYVAPDTTSSSLSTGGVVDTSSLSPVADCFSGFGASAPLCTINSATRSLRRDRISLARKPVERPRPPATSLNDPQDAPVRARAVQPAPTERVAHHERAPPDAAAPELVRPAAPPERLLPRRRGPRQQRLHVDPRRRRARQRARQPGQTLERPPTDDDGGACAGPGQDPPAVAEDDDGGHLVGVQDPRELPPPGPGRVGLCEHDAVLLLALTLRRLSLRVRPRDA
ncbi:hypothetical protein THAOC_25539, partial [Thalassiosira oceanica]